jgi:hypothetical protein
MHYAKIKYIYIYIFLLFLAHLTSWLTLIMRIPANLFLTESNNLKMYLLFRSWVKQILLLLPVITIFPQSPQFNFQIL